MHQPWDNLECLERVYQRIKEIKPDVVVQVGDLYDFFNLSNFARSLNVMTPGEEYRAGREGAEAFWGRVRESARKARKIQLRGNHEMRLVKRLHEKAAELEPFVDLNAPFRFDGVETQTAENREVILPDGTVLMHGFLAFGQHVRNNLASTIRGHLHTGRVECFKLRDRIVWE